jgi:hypothetical protein
MVTFEVPERFREHAPAGAARAALCPECLALEATDNAATDPQFHQISSTFPTDETAAVPLALAVGLLDSLALNRGAIEELLEAVERQGTDPMLVLDRLQTQGGVEPEFDLARRRHQLEQLMG